MTPAKYSVAKARWERFLEHFNSVEHTPVKWDDYHNEERLFHSSIRFAEKHGTDGMTPEEFVAMRRDERPAVPLSDALLVERGRRINEEALFQRTVDKLYDKIEGKTAQ